MLFSMRLEEGIRSFVAEPLAAEARSFAAEPFAARQEELGSTQHCTDSRTDDDTLTWCRICSGALLSFWYHAASRCYL